MKSGSVLVCASCIGKALAQARILPLISRVVAGSVSWMRSIRVALHGLEGRVDPLRPERGQHPEDELLVEVRTHGADGLRVRLQLPPSGRPVRVVELPGGRHALRDETALDLRELRMDRGPF